MSKLHTDLRALIRQSGIPHAVLSGWSGVPIQSIRNYMSKNGPALGVKRAEAVAAALGYEPVWKARMRSYISTQTGSSFAALTLSHVAREFPNAPQLVMEHAGDIARPRELHPVFYGSFDWHSCVHGYWQLATLRRLFPDLPQRAAIESRFDEALTAQKVAGEMAYFNRPFSRGFERPYGWAWLLKLADELLRHDDERGRRWHAAVLPLARLIAGRFVEFCAKAVYPIRAGMHSNTAFAATLAHAYAISHGDEALRSALEASARRWYASDENCQAWEPSLDDFLSPALVEAMCMRTILPREKFADWLGRFLPSLSAGEPRTLFEPAVVSDRSEGKLVHLDGLNLS
ncbi:MAG: DUF2891 domain-containing protein, partial [Gemmatimonadaceae bacterium]